MSGRLGKRRDTMCAPTVHVGNDRLRIGKFRRRLRSKTPRVGAQPHVKPLTYARPPPLPRA